MTTRKTTEAAAEASRLLTPEEVSAALLRFFEARWQKPESRVVMERILAKADNRDEVDPEETTAAARG